MWFKYCWSSIDHSSYLSPHIRHAKSTRGKHTHRQLTKMHKLPFCVLLANDATVSLDRQTGKRIGLWHFMVASQACQTENANFKENSFGQTGKRTALFFVALADEYHRATEWILWIPVLQHATVPTFSRNPTVLTCCAGQLSFLFV